MATVNIYLNYNGNCEEAFTFYKNVFGKEFSYIGRFNEMPPQEGTPLMSEQLGNKIMHVGIPISAETMLMGSDNGGEWGNNQFVQGNNFSISIATNSKQEADDLFIGLAAGGKITMPIADMFWGDYFGMLTDQFGINWMVNFNPQK